MSNTILSNMSSFELARWYSLIEAVDMIAEECEKRGKNFDKMKISPLDVEKYIEGTCDQFVREIENEKAGIEAATELRRISINIYNTPIELQEVMA